MEQVKEHIKAEKQLVPELRFKEFDGDWILKNIENVANKVTSGSRDWAQYYSDSGDKFIRMTNLPKKGIYLLLDDLKYVKLPEESSEGKRTSLDSGDILISITAELGKIGWVPESLGLAYINQHTALIKPTSEVDSKYVAYQLSTSRNNKKLNRLNDSGAKSGLNLSTIRSFSIPFPSIPEQQKIASFLSAVDEKIQQLTKKKALLEQYKKGVMQQLFSGQLRFKDENGNPYPDWEEKLLRDLIKTIADGGTPSTTNPNYYGGDIKWLVIDDIQNEIYNSKQTLTSEGLAKCSSKLWEPETLIMSTGATIGELGILKIKAATKQGICGIVVNENSNNLFLKFWLNYNMPYMLRFAQGSSIKELRPPTILKFKILVPCFKEQQKIATYLSRIDTKIESVTHQITQTQTFKKGLLQQMFV